MAVLSRYSTGIRQVRIMRERGSNLSRGFCFVDFVSVESATTMLKGSLAVEIDGRLVKMSYAKPKDSMNLVFGGKQADESLTMHARDVAQKAIAGNPFHNQLLLQLGSILISIQLLRTFQTAFATILRTTASHRHFQIVWVVWGQILHL